MRPKEADYNQKVWQGASERALYSEYASIGEILFNSMSAFPANICQIDDGENGPQMMTNKEALLKAFAISKFIEEIDLRQDKDVISIISPNTLDLLPIVLGSFFKAIPINPLFSGFHKVVFEHMLNITKPRLIFVDEPNFEMISEMIEELSYSESVTIINTGSQTLKDIFKKSVENFKPDHLRRDSHQTAAIVCSSGTTALPKAICLSHKCFHMKVTGHLSSDDVLLCLSHLFWISGLYQLVTSLTTGATRIITRKPFSGQYFLELIEKYKATYVMSTVSQLTQVVKDESLDQRNLSSVKCYIVSGEPVPRKIADIMDSHMESGKIFVGYGMTEAECAGSMNFTRNTHPNSVGKPGPNSMFKIVDDEGNSLSANQEGEVCFRRIDKVFGGYYKNPEATKEICDSEGFMHSKDIGYFDCEGFLYIIGRKTDLFKGKHREYIPVEIEKVVLEMADVLEICCFGVEKDGLVPGALIVKSKGSDLSEIQVKRKVEENGMNLDGGVFFVDEIPKSFTDKYSRRGALEMFIKLKRETL